MPTTRRFTSLTGSVSIPIVFSMSDSNTSPTKPALPIGQVARLAGVTPATIRTWEKDGKLTSYRSPGGQRRFHYDEVHALIAAPALADGGAAE